MLISCYLFFSKNKGYEVAETTFLFFEDNNFFAQKNKKDLEYVCSVYSGIDFSFSFLPVKKKKRKKNCFCIDKKKLSNLLDFLKYSPKTESNLIGLCILSNTYDSLVLYVEKINILLSVTKPFFPVRQKIRQKTSLYPF